MIRLALRVRREHAELALIDLLELAPGGFEECDQGGEMVEYAVYGSSGELPSLPDLHASIGDALVEVSTSEVADDWQLGWRRFHRPVLLQAPVDTDLPSVRVRPPWTEPLDHPAIQDIVIDPGQAFGTGAHATTKLCLELLLRLAASERGGGLIDLGTGSGVLAIAAAKLGFEPVIALDNDLESIAAAKQNAIVNGVSVEVRRYDLRSDSLPRESAKVVLANLLRPLLLQLAAQMSAVPEHLIASGLLLEEADDVVEAFCGTGQMRERTRAEEGEWAAIWLQRIT